MKIERIEFQLELVKFQLLTCDNPDKAQRLIAEIHRLKANLWERRERERRYQSRHRKFQRTLIPG